MAKPGSAKASEGETEALNVEIPSALRRRLGAFVEAEKGRTLKAVVAAAIEVYLARETPKKKRGA